MTTDMELLEMVQRGEPAGAAGLFERHAAAILRYVDRMLGSRPEAEEITQDVFVRMINRADQYDGRAAVRSWLFSIAINACRDRLRRSHRAGAVPLVAAVGLPATGDSALGALLERERAQTVSRALARLSDEQREALVLARYHELPHAEIARILGISEGAVKNRVFRAMEALRDLFHEGGEAWSAARS